MSDPGTNKILLPIEGMSCASCVERNARALRLLPGVARADVNFATEKATVEFDPAVISPAQLVTAVQKAGYKVITEKVTLAVGGMSCASCVDRVEKALAKAPGVISASVNFATEKATVEFIAGATTVASLGALVEKAGYKVLGTEVAGAAGAGEAEDIEARSRRREYRRLKLKVAAGAVI